VVDVPSGRLVVDVPFGRLVVATGDAAACAGTITDLTTGCVHLLGNNSVAIPPMVANFRTRRRSVLLWFESISPPPRVAG
jgi:hypothetical protein